MDDIRAAMTMLKSQTKRLTKQQYKTIKGQILNGEIEEAMKGLDKVVGRK